MAFKLNRKVAAKVVTSKQKVARSIKPREPKTLKGKIKVSYLNNKIDKVFIQINKVCYTLDIPVDYKAKYIYSTVHNDVKGLNTPAICYKIHLWRNVYPYWNIVYDGMILKVKSVNPTNGSAEFDAEELEKLGKVALDKYYSKRK